MAGKRRIDLSLNEMRTLVAVLETGTFTAAAIKLGISQPAVSRQLLRLEQRLGVSLFERSCRHPEVTAAGATLFAYARSVLSGFEKVLASFNLEADTLRGELRLEASTTYLFPDWTRQFSLKNPELKVSLLFSDSLAVEEDILDGTADLGFIGRSPIHSSLHHQAVGKDEVVLAVPAAHPFASRTEIDLEELRGQPFITCYHRSSGIVGPITSVLQQRGLEFPKGRTVLSLESDHECLQAVAQGIGLSWVTSVLFRRGDVVAVAPVRVKGFRFNRILYLIHSSRPLTPAGRAFLADLPRFEESREQPTPIARTKTA